MSTVVCSTEWLLSAVAIIIVARVQGARSVLRVLRAAVLGGVNDALTSSLGWSAMMAARNKPASIAE